MNTPNIPLLEEMEGFTEQEKQDVERTLKQSFTSGMELMRIIRANKSYMATFLADICHGKEVATP